MTTALEKLDNAWAQGRRVCVGLDPRIDLLPPMFDRAHPYLCLKASNRLIINAVGGLAYAFKPNLAFYLRHGGGGITALIDTFGLMRAEHPEVLTILDGKFGDIGETNEAWAHFAFELCKADAITANPYVGQDGMEVFYRHKEKLIFFLCKTSNPGSREFQDLQQRSGITLAEQVAQHVREWNTHGNCGLVVGATHPNDMRILRSRAGEMPILAPGYGKQEGALEDTVINGVLPNGRLLINESRSVFHASSKNEQFGPAARERVIETTAKIDSVLNALKQ